MNNFARNERPIVVAGGGIGGLACALALARRKFRVVVCEQAQEFGQVGAGLQVAPNAIAVLDALGLGDDIRRQALLIERMLLVDGITGEAVCDIPCDDRFERRFGYPYAVTHRADVHGALLSSCRSERLVELRTDSRVVGYRTAEGDTVVVLETGGEIRAGALVAADGIRSRIREHMMDDGEPKSADAVVYRAFIPAQNMPQALQRPYPTLWAGPGAHLIHYPVSNWTQFNVAATVKLNGDMMEEGEAGLSEVERAYAGWHSAVRGLLVLSSSYKRFIIRHRDPIDNWSDGPVTLLGDAAHPMVQYIAQGAAMALEDALCLADQLDSHDGEVIAAFQAYQAIRIVRTARMQISALLLDRLYHAGGVERRVRNSMFTDRTTEEYFDRMAWIFTPPPYIRAWRR
jgi:3-hydroxybenzoate 6-monooxygenase